jgi:hypothetical protein
MTAPTDSFASIVADMSASPFDPVMLPSWIHRIERLDAEMRKELFIFSMLGNTEGMRALHAELAELRARLAACEKGFEVRCNEDGTLDEVVGSGTVHLEQMNGDHWWLGFGIGPMLHVNLHARSKIKATVMDERATRASVPKDAAT